MNDVFGLPIVRLHQQSSDVYNAHVRCQLLQYTHDGQAIHTNLT